MKADKNIDGYHRKKYIAKLVLIFLLGYEVNIGQSESAFLLASTKQSEKQIGYLFLSLLCSRNDDSDLNQIIINCLASDLCSVKYYNVMLAVNCIPFCISDEMVTELSPVLHKQLTSVPTENSEYQLYLSCYLAFIKYDKQYITKYPEIFNKILKMYPLASDISLLPITNILYEGALLNSDNLGFLFPIIIQQLFKLSTISSTSPLSYYNIVSPWCIIKSLQLLQLLNSTGENTVMLSKLLSLIFSLENPSSSKSANKKVHYSNILNAVKFEAVSVVATKEVSDDCLNMAYVYLSRMLSSPETNHRFLFLENLIKMKHTPSFQVIIKDFSQKLSDLIVSEKNSGLRLQAVSVMYSVGDLSNPKKIVENMIKFLMNAEFCIREELALKICAIASKNISDAKWYVDSMINVILYGRDLIGEEVWFKVAQVVSEHKDIQEYSVKTLITFLNHPNSSENMAKLGVYLIGEYGHLVCKKSSYSSQSQYALVIGLFPFYSVSAKHIILTALVKMAFNQPPLMHQIMNFFNNDMVTQNIDTELQQRACEYRQLLNKDKDMLSAVLFEMPVFEYTESDGDDETMDSNERNIYGDNLVTSTTDLLAMGESAKVSQPVDSSNKFMSLMDEPELVQQTKTSVSSAIAPILNSAFLDGFLTSNSGILYQDQSMTIKLSSVYNKNIGSHEIRMESSDPYVHLKVVNYTTSPTTDITFSAYTNGCVNIFSGGCSFTFQSISLAPLNSGVTINIQLLASNDIKNVKSLALMLPISVLSYMIPYTIDPSNFVTIWNSMGSPELEIIEVFEASRVAESSYIVAKLRSINMEIINGIDPNPMNFVTASAFYCQSFIAGCITRIETKANSATMRLTVRSKLADLTTAISKKIMALL